MKRIHGARMRAARVGQLNTVNKRARALFNTRVWPAATYGMEGIGYTPTLVNQLRTMGADAVASTKQGRAPRTAITVAKGIKWDPSLSCMYRIISQWDLDHAPNPWARVKGPMGAAHMHLGEMRWKVQWHQ
eukprot:2174066-Karenia_brevis.AAC.1